MNHPFFRKILLWGLLGTVGYGGYCVINQKGIFRNGVKGAPAMAAWKLRTVPIAGTYFKKYALSEWNKGKKKKRVRRSKRLGKRRYYKKSKRKKYRRGKRSRRR